MTNSSVEIKECDSVNELAVELVNTITVNAIESGMQVKNNAVKSYSKPWFDIECVDFKNKLKSILKNCKNNKFMSTELINEYSEHRKKYKKMQKLKKQEYKDSIISTLSTVRDSSNFWKIINNYRSKHSSEDIIDLQKWQIYFYINRIMESGVVPNSWAKVLAKMIYKKGEKLTLGITVQLH